MKKFGLSFLVLSLPAFVGMFPYSSANAGLRVDNSALGKYSILPVADQQSSTALYAQQPQPARTITNEKGENVSVPADQIDACEAIYPNGVFRWASPVSGKKAGGPATCVADVELRAYASAGTEYIVLAHTYLAAGDMMRCNIEEFPRENITENGREFLYPADNPPTEEDVKAIMAQENKSHAGFKILGAALIGGIGGNLVGPNDPGKESALGTDKGKLISTAIGASGAAALMTASTMSNNYKAGSIILSTGMNAAAGAVAGNLLGTGDEVIRFGPCKVKASNTTEETDGDDASQTTTADEKKNCIYGSVNLNSAKQYEWKKETQKVFYDCGENKKTWICDTKTKKCTQTISLTDIKINNKLAEDFCKNPVEELAYKLKETKKEGKPSTYEIEEDTKGKLYEIDSAYEAGRRKAAYVYAGENIKNKIFGYTKWDDLKKQLENANAQIYDKNGDVFKKDGETRATLDDFKPTWQDADDGDMIDFTNRARTKSTMIGAGGGAALGALAGASGADAEIVERLATAKQEYDNSLRKVLCATGKRPLVIKYGDIIEIPEMKVQ